MWCVNFFFFYITGQFEQSSFMKYLSYKMFVFKCCALFLATTVYCIN